MKEIIWNLLNSPMVFWVCVFECVMAMSGFMVALALIIDGEIAAGIGSIIGTILGAALNVVWDAVLYGVIYSFIGAPGKEAACLIASIIIIRLITFAGQSALRKQ